MRGAVRLQQPKQWLGSWSIIIFVRSWASLLAETSTTAVFKAGDEPLGIELADAGSTDGVRPASRPIVVPGALELQIRHKREASENEKTRTIEFVPSRYRRDYERDYRTADSPKVGCTVEGA